MKKRLFILVFLLIAGKAQAGSYPDWFLREIKKEKPDELVYAVTVGVGCQVTQEELNEVVEAVLFRSRIKPLPAETMISESELYLGGHLACHEISSTNSTIHIGLRFGRYNYQYKYVFRATGLGSKSKFAEAIKSTVENAMTAYIEANFAE